MQIPTIEFCPAIREFVAVDQTQMACAVKNGCIIDGDRCPLGLCFHESQPIAPYFLQAYARHLRNRHH